jgi:hypothetical protein
MNAFDFRALMLVLGTVQSVGSNEITLVIANGKAIKIVVNRETDIRIGQSEATLSKLKPGDSVAAAYKTTLKNRHVATQLRRD